MTTTNAHSEPGQPLDLALTEGLGAGAEARGCDNCGKRGPWQTETSSGVQRKRVTYELAECRHQPKPAWWRDAGPVWVAHGCGSGCKVWAPIEAPNVEFSGGPLGISITKDDRGVRSLRSTGEKQEK